MSRFVLDASALLAQVKRERGSEQVTRALELGATISAVNLSETVAILSNEGVPESEIHEALDNLGLTIESFHAELAYRAGLLRPFTRSAGLSFGDRACLALAQELNLPVLTADRAWTALDLGIQVEVIR